MKRPVAKYEFTAFGMPITVSANKEKEPQLIPVKVSTEALFDIADGRNAVSLFALFAALNRFYPSA